MKKWICSLVLFYSISVHGQVSDEKTEANSEPASFGEWIWDDQFRPTLEASWDTTGKGILLGSLLGSALVHQYDEDIYQKARSNPNLIMSRSHTDDLAFIGSGVFGVGIALGQIYFDESNGLAHARSIFLTSLSHITIAFLVQRGRPGDREDYLPFKSSFPSGHASSAFATAASLGYAYGWKVGLPAYGLATAISLSRIAESAHWTSDVLMGAGLGIFWARASYQAESQNPSKLYWSLLPTTDGLFLSATRSF